MSYKVIFTSDALRDAKQLRKKYPSFKSDLANLIESLQQDPQQGESLGKDCYKIRLAISSKNKGKRGGARAISCVKLIDETVYLVAIYDKSEADTIAEGDLDDRLLNIP
ncbi:type II toxin-antitoxin system RelE/ParE family toxin [Spirosoma foliorum]|uniref:Type II toxin-antitoxin system RelE/ParE family toxin n=1 Tax=Spirosoma foliorum TaxID=2710596 RepID=A0A7G5GT37_9BACT|nr:type II toxin-antitoxin system RelE/ParE family toxin [Spirosoma foliorum]QMW02029.1 type II toxin-antitoxin system RelE/ParE family toxin [Spirosoma foliorum]